MEQGLGKLLAPGKTKCSAAGEGHVDREGNVATGSETIGGRGGCDAAGAVFGSAQAPADACALMGRDEFQAPTGKTEYTDPTGMPWGGGTVCGYNNGQILLFTGEN